MLDPKKNSTLVLYTIIKSEEFYGPSCSKGSRVPGSSVLIRNQAGHTHFDGSVIYVICSLPGSGKYCPRFVSAEMPL